MSSMCPPLSEYRTIMVSDAGGWGDPPHQFIPWIGPRSAHLPPNSLASHSAPGNRSICGPRAGRRTLRSVPIILPRSTAPREYLGKRHAALLTNCASRQAVYHLVEISLGVDSATCSIDSSKAINRVITCADRQECSGGCRNVFSAPPKD